MCKGTFSSENKLLGIDLRFDVMGLTRILEEATGKIPTTPFANGFSKMQVRATPSHYPTTCHYVPLSATTHYVPALTH